MRLRNTLLLLISFSLQAADTPELQQILARLDRLENENQKLLEELRALRQQLTGSQPAAEPLTERVEVLERRTEEHEQTKVQTAERYPVTITGMALFNAFINGKNNGGSENPLTASLAPGSNTSGATVRQSLVGLRFHGPQTFAGGRVSGWLDFDLFGGTASSVNHLVRLRTAVIRFDWTNTSFSVGQDKPLISQRDPDSLSQVGFSPLTGAGNIWLWQPQVRVERRFSIDRYSGIVLQGSVYKTRETYPNLPANYIANTEQARPGLEGRAEFWHVWGREQRLEIASSFHASTTHVIGLSRPSRALAFDWRVDPLPRWQITGAFHRGENMTNLGAGNPGLTDLPSRDLVAVHQTAGWIQNTFRLTTRLKLNAFAGEQDNRPADLVTSAVRNNLALGGNFMYQLSPNVILGLEAIQLRTRYLNSGLRLHDHYDLAFAYLF